MEFFDAIAKRGSYRDSFIPQTIPHEDLLKIVDAGIRAPSGCNAQTTSFVIVDDPKLIRQIADLMNKPFCQTASAMIVCVTEVRDVFQGMEFCREDCAAATENLLLAITALGYASVWLQGILRMNDVEKKIGQLLKIPASRNVEVVLPIGIPEKAVQQNGRLSFEKRVSFNQWGNQ